MRFLSFCSTLLLLTVSAVAQPTLPATAKPAAPAVAAPAGAPSQELMENYFKRVFGYDSNLQIHVVSIQQSANPELFDVLTVFATPDGQQAIHWYVTRNLESIVAGDLRPFGSDPFAHDRAELAKSAFGPTRGPVNAKLLIVEFADLECPACREADATMEKLYADYPEARFVFQSFPLSQLHPWAFRAATYLDCISRANTDQAFSFISSVYTHQREIEGIVHRTGDDGKSYVDDAEVIGRMKHYAETSGADPAKMQACADSTDAAARVQRSIAIAQALGVNSTPTLYVNGRHVGNPGSVPYEALKTIISFEADQAAAGK